MDSPDGIIDKSSPSELFYLDFFANLPLEIVEKILYHLDLTTFTNCTMVCKQWYSIISSNYRLWVVACKKLGLSVKQPQFPDVLPDYKNIFLKMRNRFTGMQNGAAVLRAETVEPADCMHYHKGIIATENMKTIKLWRVEPRLEFLLKIDTFMPGRSLTCLHFDDSFLVAGTITGQVFVWKLPSAKMYYQVQHTGLVTLVKFNKDIDLLITAANRVSFWCLSTGQFICSDVDQRDSDELVMQLHLVHIPVLPNGHDYKILFHTSHHLCWLSAYSFDSKCISATFEKVHIQVDGVKYPIKFVQLNTSYVSGCFLYFMTAGHHILYKWDIANGIMANEFEIMGPVELVAVGIKYACFLQRISKNVFIYDISTGTNFATLTITKMPSISKAVVHGDTSWLDGFDGFNDKGILLICYCDGNVVNMIKWLP